MSVRDLTDLAQVATALFEKEQARVRDLLKREGELRRALSDLDSHRRTAASLPPADLSGSRAVGADLLWLGWVARKRAELNTELAQVLVRKAGRMADLRHAFGRKTAIDEMTRDAQASARAVEAKCREQAIQALGLMRPGD